MPAIHDEPEKVKVVHQYGLGVHCGELYPDYLNPSWQQKQFLDYVDFAIEAEALGFDGLTLTEHHVPHISNPSPHILLANVAAKTTRIRLGTAVTVLPFYQPVRAVEEAAMLDLLSNGRFELGLGRGSPREFAHATGGTPEEAQERFIEGCDLVEIALRNEKFTFNGKYTKISEPFVVTPLPIQRQLPVWVAAQSAATIALAAKKGWNLLRNFGDNSEHRIALEHYMNVAREHGRELSGANFMISRFVCIAHDEDVAKQNAERLIEIFSADFPRRRDAEPTGFKPPWPPLVCGTPDQVLKELQKTLRETGARRLMVEAISMEETQLFAREVLPALRHTYLDEDVLGTSRLENA